MGRATQAVWRGKKPVTKKERVPGRETHSQKPIEYHPTVMRYPFADNREYSDLQGPRKGPQGRRTNASYRFCMVGLGVGFAAKVSKTPPELA